MKVFTDEQREEIINDIIFLELEQLFDYSLARADHIRKLRDDIEYYKEVLPQ
jgi:hypothetical protein